MICPRCDDKGAVRVQYRSGEPFDVGLCSCQKAAIFRSMLDRRPDVLEAHFQVPFDRIWPLETLVDEGELIQRETNRDILVTAGKVDRAGLGGKKVRH